MSTQWQEINDNLPPLDTNVILGWWQGWPTIEWRVEIKHAGSRRGGWRDGSATHWMPITVLPSAPTPEPVREGGTEER